MSVDPRKRGARRAEERIQDKDVFDAALRVVERDGGDGLTMRNVADEAGVATRTLYWHVGGRDALIDGLADRLVAHVVPTRTSRSQWRDEISDFLVDIQSRLLAHGELVHVMGWRLQRALFDRVRDRLRSVLSNAGADAYSSALWARWLVFHLYGTVSAELNLKRLESHTELDPSRWVGTEKEFFKYTTAQILDAIGRQLEMETGEDEELTSLPTASHAWPD